MKNKLSLFLSIGLILVFGAGCGFLDSAQKSLPTANSNKSIAEQIGDKVAGVQKTGIPECDVALQKIEQSQKSDDSLTGQATREVARRTIASYVNENSASKTPEEKQAIAMVCKQISAQFSSSTSNK